MSIITFSQKDMKKLEANPNVKRVSELAITYTDDFKKKFIEEYLSGKLPSQIFIEYEFDIDVLGKKRIHQASGSWRKAYEKNGIIGLADSQKTSSGRPLERELRPEEIITRQEEVIVGTTHLNNLSLGILKMK